MRANPASLPWSQERRQVRPPRSSLHAPRRRGYILFELIIALSIFSIGVLGLARTLNASMEVAQILNKEQRLRIAMRSMVEELRRKPLNEMATSITDAALEATFTSTVEPISLKMTRGNIMSDLYNLRIVATYTVGAEQREESVDVYVYKPAQK
ncbi:MAG: prepilin-type N-terminal cleavage/methylation domain-containing protein [Prosthecobacter sp.]|nr:prepilin-type N-terminal cleavage/methylation domain-containing protein [Prosthecobacter sp.]